MGRNQTPRQAELPVKHSNMAATQPALGSKQRREPLACIVSSNPPNSLCSAAEMEAWRSSGTCPRLGQSQVQTQGWSHSPPLLHIFPHQFCRSLPRSSRGFVAVCVVRAQLSCSTCQMLGWSFPATPRPHSVSHVSRDQGSPWGVFMGMERAGEAGLCWAFHFPHGAINQDLREKDVTLPVSSTDLTWKNSQTLPGQWERA